MTEPNLFDNTELRYLTTVKNYRLYMFTYGIISVLMVLQRFEQLEQYEECQKIIDAIREQEKRLDVTLFTEINSETINEVLKTYNEFGLTGKWMLENSEYCSQLIFDEIQSKHTK